MDEFDFGSDYDAYQSYETPQDYGGWSGDQGWSQGGFSDVGWDWQNDMIGMGFGAPQQQMALPQYEMTNPGSVWTPPSMGEQAPAIGQGARGPMEDDWLTQLKKSGAGMGVGLLTQGAGAGLQALMAPKAQKQQSLPQSSTPAGAQYTPQPLENTPGTKASPLISGRPTQVIGSQGLKGKRAPSYGGFSMY